MKILTSPLCIACNKKMKSKGRNQGYECIKCGNKAANKVLQILPRKIKNQLYIPQSSAHRHLTRPQQRIDFKNREIKFNDTSAWFRNYN